MSATPVPERYTTEQIDSFYAQGFWERTSLTDLVVAQIDQRGDRPFIFDSTTSLTYAQLRERALRVAVGLKREGVAAGDRVAVQLPNWTEFVVLAVALSRIGAVTVPIMPIYPGAEVAYVLRHSGAVAAVTCGEFRGFDHLAMFRDLRTECPDLRGLYVARSAGSEGVRSLDELAAEGDLEALDAEAGPDAAPDDPFLIV